MGTRDSTRTRVSPVFKRNRIDYDPATPHDEVRYRTALTSFTQNDSLGLKGSILEIHAQPRVKISAVRIELEAVKPPSIQIVFLIEIDPVRVKTEYKKRR